MGGGSIIEHGRGLHVRYELRGRRQNVVTYAMQLQQRNDSNAPVNDSSDHPRLFCVASLLRSAAWRSRGGKGDDIGAVEYPIVGDLGSY